MGSWNYSNICIKFNEKENDVLLIKQVMECLEFEKAPFLFLSESGVNGPQWDVDEECMFEYSVERTVNKLGIFWFLNGLFKNISGYAVRARGTSVSDYYEGEELTFDWRKKKYYSRQFCYCYSDNKAFDEEVEDNIEAPVTMMDNFDIEEYDFMNHMSFDLLLELYDITEEKGYTELNQMLERLGKKMEAFSLVKTRKFMKNAEILAEVTLRDFEKMVTILKEKKSEFEGRDLEEVCCILDEIFHNEEWGDYSEIKDEKFEASVFVRKRGMASIDYYIRNEAYLKKGTMSDLSRSVCFFISGDSVDMLINELISYNKNNILNEIIISLD